MALRPIENALPAALERPRKSAAKPAAGRPPARNDENSSPSPQKAVAAEVVEYLRSEDLLPLPEPKAKITSLVSDLDSKDWIKICEALNNARRLAVHHSPLLLPILDQVMPATVKAMKSPRSAVCKTSIMACADIVRSLGASLMSSLGDKAVDNLLLQLLLKASQDKRFVCEEAEKALEAMATSAPPPAILKKLQHYAGHSNHRVRAKAAAALSKCVSRTDAAAMKNFGLPALLRLASELLNDRLPEAREAARCIVLSVYAVFSEEAQAEGGSGDGGEREAPSIAERWENLCFSALPAATALAVVKVVAL